MIVWFVILLQVAAALAWCGIVYDHARPSRQPEWVTHWRAIAKGDLSALERLVWRGRVTAVQDPTAFKVHVRLSTPDPRALRRRWCAARELETLFVLRSCGAAGMTWTVRVSHPALDAFAQLRTAMIFRLGAGRGCGPRTSAAPSAAEAKTVEQVRAYLGAPSVVHVHDVVVRSPSREEALALCDAFIERREPRIHLATFDTSGVPTNVTPADPWSDEVTETVRITDPIGRR